MYDADGEVVWFFLFDVGVPPSTRHKIYFREVGCTDSNGI